MNMKRLYRVEGLTFVTEKAAIDAASVVAQTRKSDRDYALIMLEQDGGWYVPHSRVYKNGRLEKV